MRIREFFINRYGPLHTARRVKLSDFNLLFGRNETGKSLTIDALVKMMLGRGLREFSSINRVGETPEGYLVVSDREGTEIKLPGSEDLMGIAGIGADDCSNIFITRNSDLAVGADQDKESLYYTSVSDKLTGLKTEQIRKIRDELEEYGKITSGGEFRNIMDEKLKRRVEDAGSLLEQIEELTAELRKIGFDEMEERAARLRERIKDKKRDQTALKDARLREKYQKASSAFSNYRQGSERLKTLRIYREESEKTWSDAERELEDKRIEKKRIQEKIEGLNKERREKAGHLDSARSRLKSLDRKKDQVERLRPELNSCRNLREDLAGSESRNSYWVRLSWLVSVLLTVSLILLTLDRSLISAIVSAAFAVIAALFWRIRYRTVSRISELDEKLEKLRMNLSEIGLEGAGIEEMLAVIRGFEDQYSEQTNRVSRIELEIEHLEKEMAELRQRLLPEVSRAIKDAERRINGIKSESGVDNLKDYREKLAERMKAERLVGEQRRVLGSILGGEESENPVLFWERETEKLEGYSEKARGVRYSEAGMEKINREIEELEEELKNTRMEMSETRESMQEVRRAANQVLRMDDEPLFCQTTVDLEELNSRLREFVEEKQRMRDTALKTREIFDEIGREERKKVSGLFGPGSRVSEHFGRITGGRYREVRFDHQEEIIEVTDNGGKALQAGMLSGGAYDQLYFSIRLALGEQLLENDQGFFVMDDPFIKSDKIRLAQQMDVLEKIVSAGWQVLFFSAKEEIRKGLGEKIETGEVNFIDLEEVYGRSGI